MNIYRNAALFLGAASAATAAVITWKPSIQTRSAGVMGQGSSVSANYYGSGVQVTASKVESAAFTSGNSAFWSATASKTSATGSCFNTSAASFAGKAGKTVKAPGGKSGKLTDMGPQPIATRGETCECNGSRRRNLQWGNDGHSAASGASKNSGSKMTGSSKVETMKVSGSTKNGGNKWGGDAHATVKMDETKSATKGSSTKVAGASGGMWAGDAFAAVKMEETKASSKGSSNAKIAGAAGGMWAGDAFAAVTMEEKKASSKGSSGMKAQITSSSGKSVSFTVEKSELTLKGADIAVSSGSITTVKESKVVAVGTSASVSCTCETEFAISACGSSSTTDTIPAPAPVPIEPVVPNPSTPSHAPEPVQEVEIICEDDYVVTSAGETIEIPVLENDGFVPSGSSGAITQPNHGTTIIQESSILYVPDSDCCGIDTFTYTIIGTEGRASCTATVSVKVICASGMNTPPPSVVEEPITPSGGRSVPPTKMPLKGPAPSGSEIAIVKPVANDDYFITNQDESIAISILLNDTMFEGTTGSYTKPPNGAISTIEEDLIYTPNAGFCGTDMFSYTLTDATKEHSDSAVVTIDVMCTFTPTPSPEESIFTNAPTPDESIDTMSPTQYSGDDMIGVPQYFNNETGIERPSPEPTQYSGDDMIGTPQYFNNETDIDRPDLEDDFATTNQSVPVFVPILDNDYIPANSNGTMGNPSNGEIEATEDGIVYTPSTEFCGVEEFYYYVTDATNMYTDSALVTIDVICSVASDSPSSQPTEYTGDEETSVPLNINNQPDVDKPDLADDFATTNQNVAVIIPILANDKIPSGGTTGSFTKPQNGVVTILDGDDVLYTPRPDFCGTDMFTYTITDSSNNSATATVTVAVSCDAENTPTDGDLTDGDSVPTTQLVPVPASGVPISSPILSNGTDDKPEVNIVTTPEGPCDDKPEISNTSAVVMPTPVAANDYITIPQDSESVMINVLENDAAPDGYGLYCDKIEYDANNGACSISDDNMTISYTPNAGYTGQDSCVYSTCIEGGLCDMAVVLITVEVTQASATEPSSTAAPVVNHRPVANDDATTCAQDQTVFINVVANDMDDEDDALTVTSVAECKGGGTMVIIGDGTGGVVEYTPAAGFTGTDHCDYTVCDDKGECDKACLDVTVVKVSAPPLAVNDATSTQEDIAIEILVTGNDVSPIGSSLTIVNIGESSKGATVAIVGDGTTGYVFYEPPSGFVGNDSFTYTISDEDGQVSTATVYIAVAATTLVQATSPANDSNTTTVVATLPTTESASTVPAAQTTTVVTSTVTITPAPAESDNLPTYTPTVAPGDLVPFAPDVTVASFMCPDVDPSSVTENELLYKYPIVLGADTDIYAAIKEIEAEINNRLVTQMRCALSRTRRNLLVANLVGANSNPSDLPSNDVCEDEKGECVVIDGGLTVYGDVDIQEVQDFITAVLPSIVESAGASVIDSMMTSNATLESRSASANSGSGTITTVAIAGAALVALIGAAVFMRKKKSYNNMSDESEAVLMGEFPQKAPSPREVPHASSDDSDTLLCSESFESKSRRSVFRKKPHNGEALPSSPAFSVSSSKSKSKDIADTVDL